jgi:hypothetical protein
MFAGALQALAFTPRACDCETNRGDFPCVFLRAFGAAGQGACHVDSADVAEANLQEPKAIQGMILTLQVTDCDFNRSALDQVAKPAAILQHRHRSKIVAERRCRRESQQHVFPICGG